MSKNTLPEPQPDSASYSIAASLYPILFYMFSVPYTLLQAPCTLYSTTWPLYFILFYRLLPCTVYYTTGPLYPLLYSQMFWVLVASLRGCSHMMSTKIGLDPTTLPCLPKITNWPTTLTPLVKNQKFANPPPPPWWKIIFYCTPTN